MTVVRAVAVAAACAALLGAGAPAGCEKKPAKPTEPTGARPAPTLGDGSHPVTRALYGSWKAAKPGADCRFGVRKKTGAETARTATRGRPAYVTLTRYDAVFRTRGCGTWTKTRIRVENEYRGRR